MDYTQSGSDILLKQPDFGLDDTLDCGQAFRWEKIDKKTYSGAFLNNKLTISEEPENGVFRLHDTTVQNFENIWIDYFDLNTDYGELKRRFSENETLSKACSFAGGIRILRQDSWEALSSFIISQNNNIPRIKGIIGRLCEIDYQKIKEMPLDDARNELMKIKGVGPKVADCTLLFGFYKTDAFPKDVWVKRVLAQWYPNGLPSCVNGVEGIAQQYLFHYIRNTQK